MTSSKRRRSDQSQRQRVSGREPPGASYRLSEAGRERDPFYARMLSFVAYLAAAWLISLSVETTRPGTALVPVWSYAVLGADLALATALVKDELGLRSRLGIADSSGTRAKLVWGGLGVVAILAITILPR